MRDHGGAARETFPLFPLVFASIPLLDQCQLASRHSSRLRLLLESQTRPCQPEPRGLCTFAQPPSTLRGPHQCAVDRVRPPDARHTASAVIVATAKSQTHAFATL